jgi:hypothetical protein
LKLAIYINETLIAELSDDETERMVLEYLEENRPEHQPTESGDYVLVIPTDY